MVIMQKERTIDLDVRCSVTMEDGSEFSETQGAVSFISLLMKFVTGKDE